MSAQITNQYPGVVGRMFARQSVPVVYGAQKKAGEADAEDSQTVRDSVSLSAMAPKPLTAGFLEQALAAGKSMSAGSPLAPGSGDRLREDRVFAAVSALTLAGYSEESPLSGWPGGIPAPSREELEAARRRLAQRPSNNGGDSGNAASGGDAVLNERLELLRRVGKMDLSALAFATEAAAS